MGPCKLMNRMGSATSSSTLGAGLDWAATLSIVVAVSCGTGLEGGPPSPELIFDCALGPAAAFFLCLRPVRPRPLAFLGIGTCHRAVCGDEQAGPGHDHRFTMWPCLWHITCVVVCCHTRQMVPPARILQHFSPHAPQSDCRFGEGPKSGPTPGPSHGHHRIRDRKISGYRPIGNDLTRKSSRGQSKTRLCWRVRPARPALPSVHP